MTILDDRDLQDWLAACPTPGRDVRTVTRTRAGRPVPVRPHVAPLTYRGGGIRVSRVPHGRSARRSVSTAVTVALAGVAALITLWLGVLAQFSGDRVADAAVPDRLAVVQVQAGESLYHLAARVAPDVPATQVVERIRDLNKLDSVAVEAGQTLIAPVG